MNKTKIDWCERTVNPVVGCPNGCEWCYARRQNKRFHYVENWDQPEFKPEVLKKLNAKTPRTVFIDSMSDIGCWRLEWLVAVMQAMANNQQHKYIALTKTSIAKLNDKIADALPNVDCESDEFLGNLFLGKSITTQAQADAFSAENEIIDFLSIEPLLEPIDLKSAVKMISAIIIGAETGNRKNKVKPSVDWVNNLVKQADAAGVQVFMKESLRSIMGADFRQDPLPWQQHGGGE